MSRLAIFRSAVLDAIRSPRLWLLHFFANAILFLAVTGWLLIPVANTMHLIFNALLALVLLAAFLVLYGGTLVYFSDRSTNDHAPLTPVFRRALTHLPAVLLCLVFGALFLLLADKLETYQDTLPTYLRSILPAFLRRHITLPALDMLFTIVVFFVRWIFFSGLLFPFLVQSASNGFHAFGKQGLKVWRTTIWNITYWLTLTLAALVGVFFTGKLMSFKPDFASSSFNGEALHFAMRFLLAYVLAIFSWFLACSVVARCVNAARPANGAE